MVFPNLHRFVLVLLLGVSLACENDITRISPDIDNNEQLTQLKGKQRIQGSWRVTNTRWDAKYVVADTMTSHFVIKQDKGYNFRRLLDQQVMFTDSTLLWRVDSDPWLWYKFSPESETLFVALDSGFAHPLIAVADSSPSASAEWLPVLNYSSRVSVFPRESSFAHGLEKVDDLWYFSRSAPGGLVLEIRQNLMTTYRTIFFDHANVFEVADGILWLAGNYFVERRNLGDTLMVSRLDLSSTYSFNNYDNIYAIAVKDSSIYLLIEDFLLKYDFNGNLLAVVPTTENAAHMTFVQDRLIISTAYSTLHTVDPETGLALDSYYFPEALYGDVIFGLQGVVDLGDRLAGIRSTYESMFMYEFVLPQ